jgi:ribonuclease HI
VLIQVDGTPGPQSRGMAGVGVVVRDPWGQVVSWNAFCVPAATCNEAEYQAVIAGLELALRRYPGIPVRCLSDSRVVVEQLTGRCGVHAGPLLPLHARASALTQQVAQVTFTAIPRALNRLADALAWEALGGRQGVLRALGKEVEPHL